MQVLLSRDAAARMLGIKRNTLSIWAVRGSGPPYAKIGARCMYAEADLARFVEERKRISTAGAPQRAPAA